MTLAVHHSCQRATNHPITDRRGESDVTARGHSRGRE